ncbi:MAG TPA: hypothetical protein VMB84_05515 [Stellaceae bacterium]|nr:hypothetical protein [Stellaceae bacterium]
MGKAGWILVATVLAATLAAALADADGPAPGPPQGALPGPPPGPPPGPLILACRDRGQPGQGATLVLDLARRRLVSSTNEGPTILFGDRDVPLQVGPATVEWEVAHNVYTLSRATLELDVVGRVYLCAIAPRQF